MRDRVWIVAGLAVFAAAVTAPFWCARPGAKDLTKLPHLVLPANQKQCVAPVSYMRASHMVLLLRWRQDVVRRGQRRYVAFNGKVYQRSLTGTCLGCHSKEQFCDRCHAYVGVSGPYCWNCHNQPQTHVADVLPKAIRPDAGTRGLAQGPAGRLLARIEQAPPSSFARSMP